MTAIVALGRFQPWRGYMRLPFSAEQFFDVLRRYNEAVWPAQWLLVALALAAIVLAFRGSSRGSRVIAGILAVLWLWMGIVYHLTFFAKINPAALLFAAAFVLQAGLVAWMGVWHSQLTFRAPSGVRGLLGGVILTYALVAYPLLGQALGHRYPYAPTFGLPCPTTLFTLGLLLWAVPRAPRLVLVIPILWALIGTSAAAVLSVWEDVGLAAVAILVIGAEYRNDRRARGHSASNARRALPKAV
ncbi:MAG TPA: DUF6064 family protein [Gemmatimonadaceae bacterium]